MLILRNTTINIFPETDSCILFIKEGVVGEFIRIRHKNI